MHAAPHEDLAEGRSWWRVACAGRDRSRGGIADSATADPAILRAGRAGATVGEIVGSPASVFGRRAQHPVL